MMGPGFGEEIGRMMVRAAVLGAIAVAIVAGGIGFLIGWFA